MQYRNRRARTNAALDFRVNRLHALVMEMTTGTTSEHPLLLPSDDTDVLRVAYISRHRDFLHLHCGIPVLDMQ